MESKRTQCLQYRRRWLGQINFTSSSADYLLSPHCVAPFSAACLGVGRAHLRPKVLFIPRAQRLGSGQIVARAGYTFFNFRGRSEPFFDRCRRYLYSNRFLWSCQAVCNRLRCLQIFAGSAVQRCWTILLAERRCGGGRFSLSYFVFSSAAILARAIMKIITP